MYRFDEPDSISSDGTHVWVANKEDVVGAPGDAVTELNAFNGAPVKVIAGSGYHFTYLTGVSSDGTHVWVASGGGKSVTELAASTGAFMKVLKGSTYGFDNQRPSRRTAKTYGSRTRQCKR